MTISTWKILCYSLFISVQLILVQSFLPSQPNSKVNHTHRSITINAVRIIAANWMNANPIIANPIQIPIAYEDPTDEYTMINMYFGDNSKMHSSKYLKNAAEDMGSANAHVDYPHLLDLSTHGNPDYHFDAERFYQSNSKIVENKVAAINFINKEQFDAAIESTGKALHILQDFYSHSNWVELGMNSINFDLGTNGASFLVAPLDQPTCIDSTTDGVCTNNIYSAVINAKYLTSGYFTGPWYWAGTESDDSGNKFPKPEGKQKCSHGGKWDKSSSISATGGINKDSLDSEKSPHNYYHNMAADLALRASIYFLQSIREAVNNDQKFGRFLGIYQNRSLSFVIDTTGSMDPYISGVKQAVSDMIDKSVANGNGASFNYILVPFNDPDYGPVYQTTNSILFKQRIAALTADGGDDEPEYSYSGLKLAVEAALPWTSIHLYTDASAKDQNLKDQVLLTAKLKKLQVFYYLGGVSATSTSLLTITSSTSTGLWDIWPYYTQVAIQTGGALFPQTSSSTDIGKVNSVIETLTSLLKVTIFKSMVFLNNSKINISIPFDSTLKTANIIITGAISSYQINISEPAGTSSGSKNISVSTSVYNYMVTAPISGQWAITITEAGSYSNFSVLVVGTSDFDVLARYIFYANSSHSGFQEIEGNPSSGQNLYLEVQTTSSSAYPKQVVFMDANTYTEITRYNVEDFDPDSLTYIANVTIPIQQYFVQLIGTINGSSIKFSRVYDQIITPAQVMMEVIMQNETTILYQNQTNIINATIHNTGIMSNFQVTVSSSSGALQASVSVSDTKFNLTKNATKIILIALTANANAPVGNTTNVILQVNSSRGDFNFYQMYLVIRSSQEVITDPVIQVTSTNFNTSCLAIKEQACLSSFWYSNFTFKDVGSGINNVILKEFYGYNNTLIQTNNTNETMSKYLFLWKTDFNTNISRPNLEFKASIKSSCCIQSAVTLAINKMGLSVSEVLGKALKTPDYFYTSVTIQNDTNTANTNTLSTNTITTNTLTTNTLTTNTLITNTLITNTLTTNTLTTNTLTAKNVTQPTSVVVTIKEVTKSSDGIRVNISEVIIILFQIVLLYFETLLT